MSNKYSLVGSRSAKAYCCILSSPLCLRSAKQVRHYLAGYGNLPEEGSKAWTYEDAKFKQQDSAWWHKLHKINYYIFLLFLNYVLGEKINESKG